VNCQAMLVKFHPKEKLEKGRRQFREKREMRSRPTGAAGLTKFPTKREMGWLQGKKQILQSRQKRPSGLIPGFTGKLELWRGGNAKATAAKILWGKKV